MRGGENMEFVQMNLQERTYAGSGPAHRLRAEHKVPGVLYGKGMTSKIISFEEPELIGVIRNYGSNPIIQFDIDGQHMYGRVKELQRDPVSRALIHVDIEQIDVSSKIQATVPVVLVGQQIAESQGAIVQRQLDEIVVECLPANQPKYIEAFIGQIEVGQSFKVRDLEVAEELSIVSDPEGIIATLAANRLDPADFEEVQVVGEEE